MLLFDDSKKLEKALGEEAAAVIAHIFEKADENWKRELATKTDIQNLRENMATKAELAQTRHDILRWMVGGFIAQTALLVAVLAFLR
jgi:hypothetical protein